jgi:hypothetical protein
MKTKRATTSVSKIKPFEQNFVYDVLLKHDKQKKAKQIWTDDGYRLKKQRILIKDST